MRRARSLDLGEAFRETGDGPFGQPRRRVWVVHHIYEATDGLRYVQLLDDSDGTLKTLSEPTLLDRTYFTPI